MTRETSIIVIEVATPILDPKIKQTSLSICLSFISMTAAIKSSADQSMSNPYIQPHQQNHTRDTCHARNSPALTTILNV